MSSEDGILSMSKGTILKYRPIANSSFEIGKVNSMNVEFTIGKNRSVVFYDIPTFLIDAFNLIRLEGMNCQGLFRKEGNAVRLKSIWGSYHGCVGIPSVCSTADICSMIKRFFREIRTPLLKDLQNQLLMFTKSIHHPTTKLQSVLELCHVLPRAHLGTLAYLMRQLQYLSLHCQHHQMTSLNLATVLAPSLFRLELPKKKQRRGSREDLLDTVKADADLKIGLVQLLIENAHRIAIGECPPKPRDPQLSKCDSVWDWQSPSMEPANVLSKNIRPCSPVDNSDRKSSCLSGIDLNFDAYTGAILEKAGKGKSPSKSVDQVHSLLGAEYLRREKRAIPNRRRRRHTTPIDHRPLRRNQPNTVTSGLKPPLELNHSIDRSQSARSACSMLDEEALNLDGVVFLEEKGFEARRKRGALEDGRSRSAMFNLPGDQASSVNNTLEQQKQETINDEFYDSEARKRQILQAKDAKDIRTGPAAIFSESRPSVAFIMENRRGLVQKRVNQYACISSMSTPPRPVVISID